MTTGDTMQPQVMTVADIATTKDDPGHYIVTFNESARFYKLSGKSKDYAKSLRLLRQSKKNNQPLQVYLAESLGDIIERVEKLPGQ